MLNAQNSRFSDILSLFYGVLFVPSQCFEETDLARASGAGIIALLSVATSMAFVLAGPQSWALVVTFVGLFLLLVVAWFFNSAQAFLLTRALHHTGDWAPMGTAIALAMLPWVLVGPVFALAQAGFSSLAALSLLALAIWAGRVHHAALRGASGLADRQTTRLLLFSTLLGVGLPTLSLLAYLLVLFGALGRSL